MSNSTPQKLSKGDLLLAKKMTVADAEHLVGILSELAFSADTHQQAINVRLDAMNQDLDAVRARHAPAIEPLVKVRDRYVAERDAKLAILQAWAEQNKATLFPANGKAKRSLVMLRGTIGFRLGQPSVEVAEGKDLTAIAGVLQVFAWAKGFLTNPKPSVDKKALIAARKEIEADPVKVGLLADAGLKIVQTDDFIWLAKTENPDTAKAAA